VGPRNPPEAAQILSERRLAQGKIVRANGLLIGLVVVDAALNVVASNADAVQILTFPAGCENGRRPGPLLREKIRPLVDRNSEEKPGSVREFRSGKRTYLCRSFVLNARLNGAVSSPTRLLVLERRASTTTAVSEAYQKFGLSPREQETIQLLLQGLTSKEIAARMKISPNTVKSFLRLVMVKMSVSTRSGIVGKVLGAENHGSGLDV
jgi:DNA-binding CsgD family transcriptional regulator